MVRARGIDLANLLEFDQDRGLIRLKGYRMVMMSASSLGALRKELIETLGPERARGVLKRFGHAAGLADGLALSERFPDSSPDRHMDYGPALHALEGVAHIVRIPNATRIDLARGVYRVEAYWDNSYEAEQHLELLGPSDEPVCWTLVGYATGHSAVAAGRPTVVVETECRAMGRPRCRFVVGLADEMPEAARREAPDYAPLHLPAVLAELHGTLDEQRSSLRSKERTISRLQSELRRRPPPTRILGSSESLGKALDLARRVAPVGSTVLILGESGTGKELLARSIHEQSARADGPFVAVNCSALPESLQEAELFGFVRGAFTGAATASTGLFEAANGGTLFLDEVGDLAPSAQTKILRAIQEGEVKRLGETRVRKVDVRVLAATHQDLEAMVRDRRFREDLYYRLGVVAVTMPPLRDRGNDALLLADHFAGVYAGRFEKAVGGLSRDAKCAIAAWHWPGNVRELENAIQRAVILAQGERIELEDLPERVASGQVPPSPTSRKAATPARKPLEPGDDEARRIRRALAESGGQRDRAASLLGISRTTLWRRMKKLGIAPGTAPAEGPDS